MSWRRDSLSDTSWFEDQEQVLVVNTGCATRTRKDQWEGREMAVASRWKKRPAGSIWGDFGEDDPLGRLNLLTPEKVTQGVAEAREGLTFCLSLPLDYPGGNILHPRWLQRFEVESSMLRGSGEVKFDWCDACRKSRDCRGEQRANY